MDAFLVITFFTAAGFMDRVELMPMPLWACQEIAEEIHKPNYGVAAVCISQ